VCSTIAISVCVLSHTYHQNKVRRNDGCFFSFLFAVDHAATNSKTFKFLVREILFGVPHLTVSAVRQSEELCVTVYVCRSGILSSAKKTASHFVLFRTNEIALLLCQPETDELGPNLLVVKKLSSVVIDCLVSKKRKSHGDAKSRSSAAADADASGAAGDDCSK
jgi:hypothetical protein